MELPRTQEIKQKLAPKKREGDISNMERVENVKNEIASHARMLLALVSEELDPSGFTFEEIVANFNFLTEQNKKSSKTILINYGKEHIGFLLERGFLEETEKDVYEITPSGFEVLDSIGHAIE